MRCTETAWQWRPESARSTAGDLAVEDRKCEIDVGDRVGLCTVMFDEVGVVGDTYGGVTRAQKKAARGPLVDLWPYANTPEY